MPITKSKAIELIDKQILLLKDKEITATYSNRFDEAYHLAYDGTEHLLSQLFDNEESMKFRKAVVLMSIGIDSNPIIELKLYKEMLGRAISHLMLYKETINNFWEDEHLPSSTNNSLVTIIERLARRFPEIVNQLTYRHNNRHSLVINDEYDVQDLFHALLRIYFDDIRDEEWTPSYASSSTRMDLLLYEEKTVIELKMTRQNLKQKK